MAYCCKLNFYTQKDFKSNIEDNEEQGQMDVVASDEPNNISSFQKQDDLGHYSKEARRIQCSKCESSHIWICTNRSKAKARWCEDCCLFHQAKDGDGWIEYKYWSLGSDRHRRVEIPRVFVCAESKIFDASEWAICQGISGRPNTHRPSFHVIIAGLENDQHENSRRSPWDLDAEIMVEDEEESDLWLEQTLESGLFCETSNCRKSWIPFKLPRMKGKKQ